MRNIFGKKKAKEECARLTLEYLVDVQAKRGGENGSESGLGLGLGELRKNGSADAVERDSDADEFEDAVEQIGLVRGE